MITDEPIRYPDSGRKFFHKNGHNDEVAWLDKPLQEFGSYASSYQIGAIQLLDISLRKPRQRDYLIYPTVFLIRHYIELRLKELIQGLNFCLEYNKDYPTGHNLQTLWSSFKKKYSEIGEDINDPSFTSMDSLIAELQNIDPISMSFRYPVDKTGNKTQKLETINITELKETFIRVSYLFDAISAQLSDYVDLAGGLLGDMYDFYQ
jgi:hypothetical protein